MICPVEIVSDLSASRAARASAFPRRTDGCLPLRRGASLYINSLLSAFGEVAGHRPLAVFLQQRGHGFDHAGSALEVGLVLDDHVLAAQCVGNLGGVSCAFQSTRLDLARGARGPRPARFSTVPLTLFPESRWLPGTSFPRTSQSQPAPAIALRRRWLLFPFRRQSRPLPRTPLTCKSGRTSSHVISLWTSVTKTKEPALPRRCRLIRAVGMLSPIVVVDGLRPCRLHFGRRVAGYLGRLAGDFQVVVFELTFDMYLAGTNCLLYRFPFFSHRDMNDVRHECSPQSISIGWCLPDTPTMPAISTVRMRTTQTLRNALAAMLK